MPSFVMFTNNEIIEEAAWKQDREIEALVAAV